MGLTAQDYEHQLAKKHGERRKSEFRSEWPTVSKYFAAVSERLAETYDIEKVLAVGGTGIVHIGSHKRFHQSVVVKINRPNIDPESISMVENEANMRRCSPRSGFSARPLRRSRSVGPGSRRGCGP